MEKLNIAEILKDCPKGMELDCTLFDDIYFDCIDDVCDIIKCYIQESKHKIGISFDKYGHYSNISKSKCVIFPKGKRTWEGFVPPCQLEDGKIVATNNGLFIGIIKVKNNRQVGAYCSIDYSEDFRINSDYWFERMATEEEKQKLFDAIKENGYKWNEETKTLEKVLQPLHYKAIQPKFKVGDIVQSKTVDMIGTITLIDNDEHDYQVALKKGGIIYILFEFQDDWELAVEPKFKIGDKIKHKSQRCDICTVKDIQNNQYIFEEIWSTLPFDEQHHYELVSIKVEPKFKVGDVIQYIDTYKVKITAVNIEEECYEYESLIAKGIGSIMFSKQDEWELVPNKFDITTLKPFDKVLVRNTNKSRWCGQFYMSYDENEEYLFECTYDCWRQCIPYEGNEHLLGTTNDCDNYYKTW